MPAYLPTWTDSSNINIPINFTIDSSGNTDISLNTINGNTYFTFTQPGTYSISNFTPVIHAYLDGYSNINQGMGYEFESTGAVNNIEISFCDTSGTIYTPTTYTNPSINNLSLVWWNGHTITSPSTTDYNQYYTYTDLSNALINIIDINKTYYFNISAELVTTLTYVDAGVSTIATTYTYCTIQSDCSFNMTYLGSSTTMAKETLPLSLLSINQPLPITNISPLTDPSGIIQLNNNYLYQYLYIGENPTNINTVLLPSDNILPGDWISISNINNTSNPIISTIASTSIDNSENIGSQTSLNSSYYGYKLYPQGTNIPSNARFIYLGVSGEPLWIIG
jgi:hypothetical protein